MSVEMWQKLQDALADLASLREEMSGLRASYDGQTAALQDYGSRIDKIESKIGKTLTIPKK